MKINEKVIVDSRLKRKIGALHVFKNGCCLVEFKDLEDVFFFNDDYDLQNFLNQQTCERFYDKELRHGYFDYINENNETLRYYVESNRGTLKLIKEECLK